MTATINSSRPRKRGRPRTLRFSSMECLGFSDASSTWSDSPVPFAMTVAPPSTRAGRHVAPPPESDPIAAWQPAEFGNRLAGSNIRWSVIVALVVLVATTAGLGYWLSQRAAADASANSIAVEASATALDDALPELESFNSALVDSSGTIDTLGLSTIDGAARDLFTASGAVPDSERATRSAAAAATAAALDGVRLAGDAHAYRSAVSPILVVPELETDPALIELDQAARDFGVWQLGFDEVRNALPDGVLPEVTQQLDALSADLTTILRDYMDALAADDGAAAAAVLGGLADQIGEIDGALDAALVDVHDRVETRVAETRTALDDILPG
ncbi:MAG TPA: hypothetical protein VI141_03105 [Acidimicrobiia bacterium]